MSKQHEHWHRILFHSSLFILATGTFLFIIEPTLTYLAYGTLTSLITILYLIRISFQEPPGKRDIHAGLIVIFASFAAWPVFWYILLTDSYKELK